jgi:hypothetical protein
LNRWADDTQLDKLFKQVGSKDFLIVCTVSLLEVGFGPQGKASANQIARANEIYDLPPVDNTFFAVSKRGSNRSALTRAAYNPNHQEWLAARTFLLDVMHRYGRKLENLRNLSHDSLIYACAWNSRSAIVSANLRDFVLLNTVSRPQRTRDGNLRHVPIFTVNDLSASLTGDVSYPENIPKNLRSSHGF